VNTITETMDDARRYTSKRPQPRDEADDRRYYRAHPDRCLLLEDAEGIVRAVIWPDGTKLVDGQPV